MWLDDRDSANQNAIAALGYWSRWDLYTTKFYFQPVHDILFKSWIYPIKNPDYKWSNSGSEDIKDNTLLKRPTKWIWDKILSKFGIDFFKGSNPDQMQCVITFYAISGCYGYLPLVKILLGFIIRLGFFPNGEHIAFKPSILAPIARCWHIKPIYWVLDAFEWLGSLIDYSNPQTTTKIRLYLYLICAELQPTVWTKLIKKMYAKETTLERAFSNIYFIYFGPKHVCYTSMRYDMLKEPYANK